MSYAHFLASPQLKPPRPAVSKELDPFVHASCSISSPPSKLPQGREEGEKGSKDRGWMFSYLAGVLVVLSWLMPAEHQALHYGESSNAGCFMRCLDIL